MATKTNSYKWGVFNRKTGKIARMSASGSKRMARFSTREQARIALREGQVYADSTKGKVDRITA